MQFNNWEESGRKNKKEEEEKEEELKFLAPISRPPVRAADKTPIFNTLPGETHAAEPEA